MIWMFERGGESLRLETRYDNATSEFVLIRHQLTGEPQVERFRDEMAFGQRLEVLEKQLTTEHWNLQQGGPVVLRDGWKIG
jgi:hypothetical protein